MSNLNCFDKNLLNLDPETVAHLPRSFQLMIEIERRAQEKVDSIIQDIQSGKTTLEEVKRTRGLVE
jgi:hypothetical protein